MVPSPSDTRRGGGWEDKGVIQAKHLESLQQGKCSINATWYSTKKNYDCNIHYIMQILISF